MNLQRLEGFYWVAKLQGYARAARSFPYPITQPGVYQQVRRLEDDLGVKLFERVGKDKVVLTPRGQLFIRCRLIVTNRFGQGDRLIAFNGNPAS